MGLVAILIPMILLGSFLGVLINIMFPSTLILIPLASILIFGFYKTLKTGVSKKKEEDKKFAEAK